MSSLPTYPIPELPNEIHGLFKMQRNRQGSAAPGAGLTKVRRAAGTRGTAGGLGAVQLQGQTRSQNSGVRQPAVSLQVLGRVKPQEAGPPR